MKNLKNKKILAAALILFSSVCFGLDSDMDKIKDKSTEIEASVVMLLKKDAPWSNIKVHAYRGNLQAAGFVENVKQKNKIENILKRHEKDYRIYNSTVVVDDNTRDADDVRLVNAIEHNLKEVGLPMSDIYVQACNGRILLSGFVENSVNLKEIEKTVSHVEGVRNLHNFLLHKS